MGLRAQILNWWVCNGGAACSLSLSPPPPLSLGPRSHYDAPQILLSRQHSAPIHHVGAWTQALLVRMLFLSFFLLFFRSFFFLLPPPTDKNTHYHCHPLRAGMDNQPVVHDT